MESSLNLMIPDDWRLVSPASTSQQITLNIALKQENLSQLEAFVQDVSNPQSKNYGTVLTGNFDADSIDFRRLSARPMLAFRSFTFSSGRYKSLDQIKAMVAPREEALSAVRAWLHAAKVLHALPASGLIFFSGRAHPPQLLVH